YPACRQPDDSAVGKRRRRNRRELRRKTSGGAVLRPMTAVVLVCLVGCAGSAGERPTEEIVARVLRTTHEKPATNLEARMSVEVHSVKLGDTEVANEQDVVDGIPQRGAVTAALI